jgi:hypothetical protein
MEEPVKHVCNVLLQPENPAETSNLKISYHFSPTELADRWKEQNSDSKVKFYGLSITDSSISTPQSFGDQFSFETARAGDLTGVGMKINQIVGKVSAESSTILVCLDSLDGMLMYKDEQTVYRFVRTISNFLSANNAKIHFHIDPTQNMEIVNTLKSAVNAIVRVEESGDISIKAR